MVQNGAWRAIWGIRAGGRAVVERITRRRLLGVVRHPAARVAVPVGVVVRPPEMKSVVLIELHSHV